MLGNYVAPFIPAIGAIIHELNNLIHNKLDEEREFWSFRNFIDMIKHNLGVRLSQF